MSKQQGFIDRLHQYDITDQTVSERLYKAAESNKDDLWNTGVGAAIGGLGGHLVGGTPTSALLGAGLGAGLGYSAGDHRSAAEKILEDIKASGAKLQEQQALGKAYYEAGDPGWARQIGAGISDWFHKDKWSRFAPTSVDPSKPAEIPWW